MLENIILIIMQTLVLCAVLSLFLSGMMMERYLIKRKKLALWRVLTSSLLLHTVPKLYYETTKEEHGRVGIWFKVFILSFPSFILLLIVTVILSKLMK